MHDSGKFHELLLGALQGARLHSLMLICYIMLSAGRLARRLKGAREICYQVALYTALHIALSIAIIIII